MTDRFSDQCLKEAAECRREAERAVSPLDKEAWLRLAAEWSKLAASMTPDKAGRG